MLGVARGLEYIHANQIVHRDVACRNILVESRRSDYAQTWQFFHAKLGDFGLAREYNNVEHNAHQPGYEMLSTAVEVLPWNIFAPELFNERPSNDPHASQRTFDSIYLG